MKTSELIGPALDWAVAKCEGHSDEDAAMWATDTESPFTPSTNRSQGTLIIEREGIYLRAVRYSGHPLDGQWLAQGSDSNTGCMVQWVKREDWKRHYYVGPTLLIAAMRCYVASKLGDEVDIPAELIKQFPAPGDGQQVCGKTVRGGGGTYRAVSSIG